MTPATCWRFPLLAFSAHSTVLDLSPIHCATDRLHNNQMVKLYCSIGQRLPSTPEDRVPDVAKPADVYQGAPIKLDL